MDYMEFIQTKRQVAGYEGIRPLWIPDWLFDFQKDLTEWAIRKGRAAIFADCGLGKTPMQLVWAQNIANQTNGRVLVLTPLAVSKQTQHEAEKFGVSCEHSRNGKYERNSRIIITNYERLHYFDKNDFIGCVCDESSILKNFAGATRTAITDFMRELPYRLLCTATPSPNDYIELGTSSEALGWMRRREMLAMFFTHDSSNTQKWELKGHAIHPFWRWVCSWARAIRQPSDLGYNNDGFILPEISHRYHFVKPQQPREGMLFDVPATTVDEQREERRRTITKRCEMTADLINKENTPVVCWGYLNDECDRLTKLIPDAVQVKGSDSDESKEQKLDNFANGNARVLVTKPAIGAWGLNWQHCAHQTFFPSHSFEQYYQAIRRSWRFGQQKPVMVDIVASESERNVMDNLDRKSQQIDYMFAKMAELMNDKDYVQERKTKEEKMEVPAWM